MTSLAGRTVMVTGGCGFIGSHLVRAVLATGAARVLVVDSLRYGSRANLGPLGPEVTVIPHTIGSDDPAALARPLSEVDVLFHFAAEKHNQSADRPYDVFRSNVEGTHTLFELAAQAGVKKIVFASSLYAYGRMTGPPLSEDERPEPRTVYGISKLCGEHLLRMFGMANQVPWTVLRYLFVYGPRQFAGTGYKSVIVKTFERLLRGEAPIVYGDGEQALDYVFVDDAVAAAIAAATRDAANGEVVNVATSVKVTVNQMVAAMQSVAGTALPVRYEAADWTAGSCRVGDNRKAQRVLAWQPRTPLAEGLRKTYEWLAEPR